MPSETEELIQRKGTAITLLFAFEMGLKLFALGCQSYWADHWNVLDGTIVIMSAVDLTLSLLATADSPSLSFLRILRMLRVLRMLRLMRSWKGLYRIVMTFIKALPAMNNIMILMFLINLICALLGMQIFGAQVHPPPRPRPTYTLLPRTLPLRLSYATLGGPYSWVSTGPVHAFTDPV